MNNVITIGRQFGSGGHEVGVRLAKKLGIPFYDRELLSMTSMNSRFDENYLKSVDEKKPKLISLGAMSPIALSTNYYMIAPNDEVFIEMGKVMQKLADEGPCEIVGRCSDYILRDRHTVNFFLFAEMKDRINRKLALEENKGISESDMEKLIISTDKDRAKFYEYYTHDKWGDSSHYDLCLNTSSVGVDGAVEVMLRFLDEYHSKSILPD